MLQAPEIRRLAASESWQALLAGFPAVGLDEVRNTASSDRIDTKFVLGALAVKPLLRALAGDYSVLDIDGLRFTTYRTQYFDTPDLEYFRRHHAGAGRRHKVRTRLYTNTGLSCIEIKARTPRGRTTKLREKTAAFETVPSPSTLAYLERNGIRGAASLRPVLQNSFDRICLVDRERPERLTIDLDIVVETDEVSIPLPGIAIAEFKQERDGRRSREPRFLQQMRAMHLRPYGFSKYCIGLLLCRPDIKHNLFRPQLRQLQRLAGEVNAGS